MIPFPQRKHIKYNVIFSVKYRQITISVLKISLIAMYFLYFFLFKNKSVNRIKWVKVDNFVTVTRGTHLEAFNRRPSHYTTF